MSISTNTRTLENTRAVYFGGLLKDAIADQFHGNFKTLHFVDDFQGYIKEQTLLSLPDLILIEVDGNEECFNQVSFIRENPILKHLIIILIGVKENSQWRALCLKHRVNDYYIFPFPKQDFISRVDFLVRFKAFKPSILNIANDLEDSYKIPFSKRMFDIIASGIALLLLSPLFIIITILIKLESKGKVIYKSKRVGAGYHIFDFYKFRSMRSDADKMIDQLSGLNQYASEGGKNGKSAFMKLSNDPRVTRIGKFLRKTSVDELPQLINVFMGDMSLVGNRPLPLYEAEQLTTNKWSTRFNGPAGLTGLWQISRRGKKDMSESERKELDNYYANNYSIFLDFKIILKTLPALIQKEEV